VTVAQVGPTHRDHLGPRTASRVAWGLWAATVMVTVAALVLLFVTRSVPRPAPDQWQLSLLSGSGMLAYATVGLIIAARRPANPLGWLLLLIGLTLSMNRLLQTYADYTLTYRPGTLPGGLAVGWVATWIWALILPLMPFLFLLFPNGRLPSRRWRPVAWAAGLAGGLLLLMAPFRAGILEYFPTIKNPVGIPALSLTLFRTLAGIYFFFVLLATTSLLVRFRRARGDDASS
jgi:two-component system NarL family sensor kinase